VLPNEPEKLNKNPYPLENRLRDSKTNKYTFITGVMDCCR
jgi:hypothetical protein